MSNLNFVEIEKRLKQKGSELNDLTHLLEPKWKGIIARSYDLVLDDVNSVWASDLAVDVNIYNDGHYEIDKGALPFMIFSKKERNFLLEKTWGTKFRITISSDSQYPEVDLKIGYIETLDETIEYLEELKNITKEFINTFGHLEAREKNVIYI